MDGLSGILQSVQEIIDNNNVNVINSIFIVFIATTVLYFIESRLPNAMRQFLFYGKLNRKVPVNSLMSRLEVPKSWFKHFYIFAISWAGLALFLMLKGLIWNATAPEFVLVFLDFVAGGPNRRLVQVNSTCGLVATILMTLQCARRCYESNFAQIFSKKSKINVTTYMVGYLHYFGIIVALLANTEGFVRGSKPSSFALSHISLLQYLCIFLFYFSWTQQYKSNMILANLRNDTQSGRVMTEQHFLPKGGFFDTISSPHIFFEIVMYLVLLGLIPNCTTWYYVAFFVVSNQIWMGLLTHEWYKKNFKNYPKNRYAIIPFIL